MRHTKTDDEYIFTKLGRIHKGYLFLVLTLCGFGFMMLYSAARGEVSPWADRQFIRFLVLLPVMLFIAITDIRIWYRHAYLLYGFGILGLVGVEIAGFVGMGAQRWIKIGGFTFQPSELMKVLLVLALARYFHALHMNNVGRLVFLIVPGALVGLPAGLVLIQPNLGTATIILLTGAGVMFMAGIGWKKFLAVGIVVAACLPFAWGSLHDYQKQRVYTFLDPESDPLGSGYNIMQSKIAIGSGELHGKGFLQGSQSQLSFLPEKETDFIFTMLAEEFGFLGGLTVMLLYMTLIITGFIIAIHSMSFFGKLIASGISIILFIHMFINMAMVMGLIPVVGVPLPMLSYGGSSLISIMIAVGFVLSVHVHRDVVVHRLDA
jgi:rod shape determining protein RodA